MEAENRVILHADMNNFFASVSCLYRPDLRGKPVAVCGDIEKRHGIILAKNMEAKLAGVKTGSTIAEARFVCPHLTMLPPEPEKYLRFSRMAREIYCEYTGQVESFGIDECWLDVTGSVRRFGDGRTIADELRRRIREELGLTASVGVSFNKVFAKMGSDYKKPDATTVIGADDFRDILWPLPVGDLLFCGRSTQKKLRLWGIDTVGQLAQADFFMIADLLGKCGAGLWQFANGLDKTPVAACDYTPVIKSIGNGTTAPRDLKTDGDVRITMQVLADSVGMRLRAEGLCCRTVQIELRDHRLGVICRQCGVRYPTCLASEILDAAYGLYREAYGSKKLAEVPLRGLTVRAADLVKENEGFQLFLGFDTDRHERTEKLERTLDDLRGRFGDHVIRSGLLFSDTELSDFYPRGESEIGHGLAP